LVGTDAHRILQGLELVHFLWSAPLLILPISALLVVKMGYSALPGIAFLVIGMAILVHSTKTYITARTKISKSTDARVGLTQEMLQAFRFIKAFADENVFLSRLKPLRAAESRASEHLHLLRSFLESVSMSLPILTNLVMVVVYVVTGHTLIPATIFSSVALINALRTPLNYFPVAVGRCSDGLNALERVKAFLLAEESSDRFFPARKGDIAIETEAAAFTWECSVEAEVPVQDDEKKSEKWRGWKAGVAMPETQASSVKELSPKSSNSDLKGVFKLSNASLKLQKGELIGITGIVSNVIRMLMVSLFR
jgi:ABC-type multidrug transport system fused ATPase/permease subunit